MTPRDPLILEIAASVGSGRITITCLDDGEDDDLHGLTYDDGRIDINPAPPVVDALIHECLHRLRPHWTERGVRRRTKQLMAVLSAPEIQTMYDLLCVSSTRRRTPKETT